MNGYNVITGAACHGWFPSWTHARDYQLKLAREEIPSEIVECEDEDDENLGFWNYDAKGNWIGPVANENGWTP
jgi:hypothetical protein